MRHSFTLTVLSVLCVLILGGAAVLLPERAAPAAESVPGQPVASRPAASAPAQPYLYLLADLEGRLAVYRYDAEDPKLVFDVYTHSLPEADQAALADGVPVGSYEELVARIEDFTS